MPVRIVEWQLPYTWGTGIEIDTDKVISLLLREENNLILVNDDNEIYTDLQLASWLTPQSDFPVWVTTGKVLEADGRPQSWLMLNWKTTSWDYARWIYCADGEIYFDGGNWVWRKVYYSSEVDALLLQLKNYVDLNFQPKLTAWAWITIDANNVISAQGAGTWDVSWPNSAVDGHLAVFDGTTWKAIKDWWPVPTQVTVVDALDSTSTTSALSANQWKVLDDKISTLAGLGKFLSLWDSTTGQPISFPYSTPYAYTTWDYFIIETVSSATPPVNYKPNGSSYTGSASSVTESDEVEVWDVYVYDGTIWLLQSNHWKTVSFWNIAGQPSDNANLDNALNSKQPKVIDVTVTTGASTVAKVGTTTGGSYTPTSWDLLLVNFVNGCSVDNPTLAIDSGTAYNIKIWVNNAGISTFDLWDTSNSNVKVLMYYNWSSYQVWSTENAEYSSMSTSEWKTGTSIATRVITASNLKEIIKYHAVDDTAFGASWDGQTDIAPSKDAVYDKINAMDTTISWKQNTLTAGTNITIQNDTISATDTTYSAGTGLSLTWTTFANTWVTSVNGNTGTVTVSEFTPSWTATTGYVVTKTANGYEWAEPAEWDKIEYVTQAEYTALLPWALTDGKHYFIYSTSGGWGWQPWVNTLAYYPLTSSSTVNDQSWNNYTLTNSWVTFTTLGWVDCANFDWSSWLYNTSFAIIGTWDFTLSLRGCPTSNSQWMWLFVWNSLTDVVINSVNGYIQDTSAPTPLNTWTYITFTRSSWNLHIYSNWTEYVDTAFSNDIQSNLYMWKRPNNTLYLSWWLSECIVEDRAWTATEITDYFNETKANYWIS